MLTGQTVHRHGAGAARAAHNREVTGSKPVAGIFQFRILYRRIPSSWTLNKHEWCEPALSRLVGDVKRNTSDVT